MRGVDARASVRDVARRRLATTTATEWCALQQVFFAVTRKDGEESKSLDLVRSVDERSRRTETGGREGGPPIERVHPRAELDGVVGVPGAGASRKLLHVAGFAVVAHKLAVRNASLEFAVPTAVVEVESTF